jgi:hypothetical protein
LRSIVPVVPLLVLALSFAFAQQNEATRDLPTAAFSGSELEEIAIAVFRAQLISDGLNTAHSFWCRDSVNVSVDSLSGRDTLRRECILEDYRWFGFRGWPHHEIRATELSRLNPWRDRFRIFVCTNVKTLFDSTFSISQPPREMIVGVDFAGTFYFLQRFSPHDVGTNDFAQIIRSHIREPLDSAQAKRIAILFLAATEGLDIPYDRIETTAVTTLRGGFEVRLRTGEGSARSITVRANGSASMVSL